MIPGADRRRGGGGAVRLPPVASPRATTTATTRFYLEWDAIAKDPATLDAWLDEWVYGLANHAEYVEKFGDARWDALRPEPAPSGEVDYGRYA